MCLLEDTIPTYDVANDFCDCFCSVRQLGSIVTAQELGDYLPEVEELETRFIVLNVKFQVSMTLKVHVVLHHFKQYFEMTVLTLRDTSGEYTETCHSTLRKEEEIHGTSITRQVGTPIHQYLSLRSSTQFH